MNDHVFTMSDKVLLGIFIVFFIVMAFLVLGADIGNDRPRR